jgi:hypothetical protein
MSHTRTVKWAFLNKRVQSHQKPACGLVVETWTVLIPICCVPVVMEEGCQKPKRLSYTATASSNMKLFGAQRRRETSKLLQFLELMKATFDCGGKTRQRSAGVRHHKGNSLDPRKDGFLKLMMQSSCFSFQERCKIFEHSSNHKVYALNGAGVA